MSRPLEDKTIIVTGAGRGIGEAAARMFAAQGARLVLANLTADQGEALLRDLTGAGHQALFVQADVSAENDVRAMVRAGVDRFDGLQQRGRQHGRQAVARTRPEGLAAGDRCRP